MSNNIADLYPLTPVQEGLLFHSVQTPEAGVYLEQLTCRIEGAFDPAAWRTAWEQIVATWPALRTLFTWEGRQQPLQLVRAQVALPWIEEDWRAAPHDLAARLAANRAQRFDLSQAPLLRFTLLRLADDAWQFIWDRHHLIMDGWSNGLLFDEALARYRALTAGRAWVAQPARPYRDYVAFAKQHGGLDRAFWQHYLADFETPILLADLIGDRQRDATRHQVRQRLPAAATAALNALARDARVTLNHIVQAAWAYVLHRYSDRDDIVFGATVAGRPAALPGADRIIGLCLNTLPLRVRIEADMPVRAWLPQVRNAAAALADHELESLAEIQRLADPGRAAVPTLFDSIVVFVNYYQGGYVRRFALEQAQVSELTYHEYSHYPLGVIVVPEDELELWLIGDGGVLSAAATRDLTDVLASVLLAMAADPEQLVRDLPVTSDGETPAPASFDPPDGRSVEQYVALHAAQRPAVQMGERVLSYGDLNRQADELAHRLRAAGVRPGDRVGISYPRGPEQIVALLAALRAGAAYVPLDPAYPPTRRAAMQSDAGVVLTLDATSAALLPPAAGGEDLPPADLDRPVYLIYTSGSTGTPKGVAVTQRQLLHSTLARRDVYGRFDGRFLLLSSFSFDSSVVGIYRALVDGGTLVLPAAGEERDADALAHLIDRARITELLCLPSLWRVVLEAAQPGQLQALQTVIVAGEACTAELVQAHLDRLPAVALYNEYGPTEATVWASVERLSAPLATVPIGRAIPRTSLHVVDGRLRPVPPGAPGELLIGGAGVTAGYWQRPDLTSQKFIRWRGATVYRTGDRVRRQADGALRFLGRVDAQVKIRGYRVEPLEVEQLLRQHPAVQEAAVVAITDGTSARLVAHVVGTAGDDLAAWLRARLPEFMLPSAFVSHAALPRTPNGKIDQTALRARFALPDAESDGAPPDGPTEQALARLWADLLAVGDIARDADFFALGGHSLLVMRLVARLRKQFGVELAVDQPFRTPTLRGLAAVIDAARALREEFEL